MTNEYPLYTAWRRISEYLMELCGTYPKNVRFTLCDRITTISLDILESIIEAIYARQRSDILRRTNLNMEKLRALMQISANKKNISIRQYKYISHEINEAGKMVGGWLKSCGE